MEWNTSIPEPRRTRRATARGWSTICTGVPRHSGLFSSPWSPKSVSPFLRFVLQRQLADLGVHPLHVDGRWSRTVAAAGTEHIGSSAFRRVGAASHALAI